MSTTKMSIDNLTDDEIKSAVTLFQKKGEGIESRYKSWDDCHEYFSNLKKKYKGRTFEELEPNDQQLSLLHLGFYLASWGMYRGSSFTLQYDKSIFKEIITIILKKEYNKLWNLSFSYIKNNMQTVVNNLAKIREEINTKLLQYRKFFYTKSRLSKDDSQNKVSQTLITKILLGTICCSPAYDSYFTATVGKNYDDFFNEKDIQNLLNHIIRKPIFQQLSKKEKLPLMKLVDMAYFTIGIEEKFKEYYYSYITKQFEPPSNKCKEVVKEIKRFYYKLKDDEDEKYAIHTSFPTDRNAIEQYISKFPHLFTKISSIEE